MASKLKSLNPRFAESLDNLLELAEKGKSGKSKLPNGLTIKQTIFVESFLITGNGAQAAIVSGSTKESSRITANQYLKNDKVLAYIQKRTFEIVTVQGITAEKVLSELANIAFQDPRDILTWEGDDVKVKASTEITSAQAASIQEISTTVSAGKGIKSVKVKFHNKLDALKRLSDIMGLTKESVLDPKSSHEEEDIDEAILAKELSRGGYVLPSSTTSDFTDTTSPDQNGSYSETIEVEPEEILLSSNNKPKR